MHQFLIFLLVGGGGFVIDAGITHLMLHAGYPPAVARLPAIGCAVVFTWLANRRLTYRVQTRKSGAELLRYCLAASMLAVFNYLSFLGLVQLGLAPLWALVAATAAQAMLSYQIYKRLVFKLATG